MAKLSEKVKARHKEQRKISLEEHCESHINNPVIKNGMITLLALFKELKMKPSWYYSGKYKCHYKKQPVVYFTVSAKNCWIYVTALNSLDNGYNNDINGYMQVLDDEIRAEVVSRFTECTACRSCAPGGSFEYKGKVYQNICPKQLTWNFTNPNEEQFGKIEKLIMARRKYLENAV